MKHNLCRAKIHRATVTGGDKNYPGSITIGRNMLVASGILPFELVHVNNIENANHWETYVIPTEEDGVIQLNGAPSHLFLKGDLVVIMAFSEVTPVELENFTHTVVLVDPTNTVHKVETKLLRELL